MKEITLIEIVREGLMEPLREKLREGVDVNVCDDSGWTPLNWAAGRGDPEMVTLLLKHGADCSLLGRDKRRAWMIASAAEHREVMDILEAAERARGTWIDPLEGRKYCKAYPLGRMREYRSWPEPHSTAEGGGPAMVEGASERDLGKAQPVGADDIVYLHQSYIVTKLMWDEEDIVFDAVTPEWITFCNQQLDFHVPPATDSLS